MIVGNRHPGVRWRTDSSGSQAYRLYLPESVRLSAHDKVRAATRQFGAHMNTKAVVSTIMAMFLAAGGFAFAQDNRYCDDRGRNEQSQGGVQQDISDKDALLLNPAENQGTARDDERQDERGAGPNHAYHRGDRLPAAERNRQYVVDDWRSHGLLAPAPGYHWVQSGGDYVLVAIATGIIAQFLLDEEIRNEDIRGQDAFWGQGNHSIFCESENSCA